MKKQALTVLAMATLLAMGSVASLQADSGGEVWADIPFYFMVGNTTYPTGSYAVQYTNPQGVFVIRIGEDESRSMLLWSNTVPAKSGEDNSPRFIFNRYGDQYFLTQVWAGGDIDGRELPELQRQRELAKEYLAENVSVPQVVLDAALRSVPVGSANNPAGADD